MRIVLPLMLVLAALPAAPAAARDRLEVRRAVAEPQRGRVVLDVVCHAPRERCAGTLVVAEYADLRVTRGKRVRLPPGHVRRVVLRLDPIGLEVAGGQVIARLNDRHGGRLTAPRFPLRIAIDCHTGETLAAAGDVRVFRVPYVGVQACVRGRSMALAEESDLPLSRVGPVAVAGRFVALAWSQAWKCSSNELRLVDVVARREVVRISAANAVKSSANGCTGSAPVDRVVVTAAGAVAWSEAPGDDGVATIRARGADGDARLLDAARDVDPGSLRLSGTTASWTRAGAARSAPLG